jgi:hypothetical protein
VPISKATVTRRKLRAVAFMKSSLSSTSKHP